MEAIQFDFSKYNIYSDGDYIIINGKKMLVKYDPEWAYKLMATHIKHSAHNDYSHPANALVIQLKKWIGECVNKEAVQLGTICLTPHEATWALRVINHVITKGKTA